MSEPRTPTQQHYKKGKKVRSGGHPGDDKHEGVQQVAAGGGALRIRQHRIPHAVGEVQVAPRGIQNAVHVRNRLLNRYTSAEVPAIERRGRVAQLAQRSVALSDVHGGGRLSSPMSETLPPHS